MVKTDVVATVDADDDSIQRYVVRHYAFDLGRHERRHQVVAAFDNEHEFRALLDSLASDLRCRRASGENVDPQEHYTGVVLEPGYRRRQNDGRLLRKAVERRAVTDKLLARLELPSNLSFVRAVYTGENVAPE